MKRLYCWLICVLLTVACAGPEEQAPTLAATSAPPPGEGETGEIGEITRLDDRVEHAPAGEPLQRLEGTAPLSGEDRIGVRNDGEALVNFGSAMRVRLFDEAGRA